MHPIFHDELNKARIADLHRQAERDRSVRASAQAHPTRRGNGKDLSGDAVGVFAHRLLIILSARGA